MGISRWLKSRLRAHIVENGAMPGPDGPHAKSEIENLGNMAFLVTMYFLFGLAGCAILVGWRFISNRIPNVGARQHTESPFAPEAWVGAYVVLAWFAFFITSQLLFSILFGSIGSGGVMSIMALGIQLAHGFFALWAIGQLGMDGPRETIVGVLGQLRIGLEPYGGRIRHVMAWGLGGYAVAIPLVVIAAILQAWLLPIESNLVSNPILPLLTDPPDALTQLLLIIAVVFAAPFFEECLFRGFLFRQLRNRMGVAPAVLISSAVFAAIHFDVGTFLHLFVLGGVLALVTERSGGLLAAMLVHGFWNGATILMTVSVFGS
jgi:membrane protease YdiL (CAAX protease family)